MWHTGLVALWHVGSSQTRARTCVPCIGRRILNHSAIREVPMLFLVCIQKRKWSLQAHHLLQGSRDFTCHPFSVWVRVSLYHNLSSVSASPIIGAQYTFIKLIRKPFKVEILILRMFTKDKNVSKVFCFRITNLYPE